MGVVEDFENEYLPLPARLDAARHVIQQLEEAIAAMRRDVRALVEDQPLDRDTIGTIYWEYDDLVPATLLGNYHQMRDLFQQTCPWTYPCPSCGRDQPLTSRSALKSLQRAIENREKGGHPAARAGYELNSFRCSACREVEQAVSNQRWREQEARHRQRLHELKTMPYREYLRTPEWQERRKARLSAARYACQVCNARNVMLNVHHRTYVRRGEEYARDLIVLCEGCHHMFHRNGSLAPHDRGED